MTTYEIIATIAATLTSILTLYTIYRDFLRDEVKKLSQKLNIKRVDFGTKYGKEVDKTNGINIFTVDIENRNTVAVHLTSVSISFQYNDTTKYITLVGRKIAIQPSECRTCQPFTYLLEDGEMAQYPYPQLTIQTTDLQSQTSRDSFDQKVREYTKTISSLTKRFTKIDDAVQKIQFKLQREFNLGDDKKYIKDIVKTAKIHIVFQTEQGINCVKVINLSSFNEEFQKFTRKF